MKLSVFGEYVKFTMIGVTRIHLYNETKRCRRMRRMN
jgi:hypothetical protein